MKLILNSESMQFQAASSFEARLDKDGVHRRDKSGGTNLPLYAVKLVAWSDADAETILVTVPVATPPALSQGDHVVVERGLASGGNPHLIGSSSNHNGGLRMAR